MLFLARQEKVQANVVRSVLGVWIWAALLRREVLCIPHSIFQFCAKCEHQYVHWWPRARQEMKAMASVVPHLIAHLGAPLSDIIFATDAMGVGRDCGG